MLERKGADFPAEMTLKQRLCQAVAAKEGSSRQGEYPHRKACRTFRRLGLGLDVWNAGHGGENSRPGGGEFHRWGFYR